MMKIPLGCADENLDAFNIIGQEPNQTDGEYRYLTVPFTEEPVNQRAAAQTLSF